MYLDYAAATPVDKRVLTAMLPYFSDDFYNPSAAYAPARAVRAVYEDARHKIAQTIGAKPAEIVMTAGATESINLAFNCICHSAQSRRIQKDDGMGPATACRMTATTITTAIEHPAILECAKAKNAVILPVDETGRVSLDELKKNITNDTRFISVGYANNEIGTVQPIKEVAELVKQVRQDRLARNNQTPLLLHTDASQAAGYLDINVARLGVDLMTLNAGKCYGPKQVGLLYVRAGAELKPLIRGGGQEMGLRSGTENVAGAVGFAVALEIAEKKRKSEVKRLGELRQGLEKYIATHITTYYKKIGTVPNGSGKHRLPNILNFSIPGLDGERLVYALDQRGICVATGSACAANKGTRSHVLTAIGLDDITADGSIRVSMGRQTTAEQIEEFEKVLQDVVIAESKLVS
ncbi:cysteine desulfurase [Alphaproteobacteria bacterium]|nr:cysteine desulfurase [Alphaproteobacteria bacterium]